MDIIVRGKHYDVPAAVEERARRKLDRLEHYLPLLKDAACEVDMAHEKAKEPHLRYVVHVTISAHGVHLQAEERAEKPETAIDQAAQALSRQARDHKDRLYERGRTRVPKEATAQVAGAAQDDEGVARVKRFPLKPMTLAEAREQMETLGHAFFVFHDADADELSVLYRRRAGDYGLIVPEPP
jgi:putative sigma-54 modulation protein